MSFAKESEHIVSILEDHENGKIWNTQRHFLFLVSFRKRTETALLCFHILQKKIKQKKRKRNELRVNVPKPLRKIIISLLFWRHFHISSEAKAKKQIDFYFFFWNLFPFYLKGFLMVWKKIKENWKK